jgi:hypothetical protein
MATISPANSTITDTVSLLLLDTSKGSNIIPGLTNNFITYISSSTVPGRIATVRDATGYVSTGNFILLSTTKNVFFADGSSTLSITQPFGFVSFSSRSTNQWSVLNTFAFPDPLGTSYVSNVNVMNSVNTSNISVNSISSSSITTRYLSSLQIHTSSIQTGSLQLRGVTSNGFLTTNTSASELLFNGAQVGAWVGTAATNLNMNSYSIYNIATLSNVNIITSNVTCSNTITAPTMFTTQTNSISSNVATNYVIPLHYYFQETETFDIVKVNLPFEQLIRVPTTSLRYSQGSFKRYSVSFQFSGETQNPSLTPENTSNIYYYCSLFNSNTSQIVNGNTINDTYSLTYTQSDLTPTKFSFSYSDVFDLTSLSWITNDAIYPYLYAKTNNDTLYKFINIKMNLTMSPIILTSI